jgi:exodeoxyribonuclease VII large subunit
MLSPFRVSPAPCPLRWRIDRADISRQRFVNCTSAESVWYIAAMQAPLFAHGGASVLSVTELVQRVRACLDSSLGEIWVSGEISNFRVPASGHFYFSLKDERCQIAAVMFRSANQKLRFRPENGLEVIAGGRVGIYDVRGDLQLYVETMEPRGLGGIQLALRQLAERLAAEGLFDESRKRPLPAWPRAVGVVTALSGAAVHDILATLEKRMPQISVVIRPVRVQGEQAAGEIVDALAELNRQPSVDVIIVGRGGGSLEDLWAFNEERVARAIVASRVPVVSAVGHEVDVTLADLAADCRAATPTAAAALVVPDRWDVADRLVRLGSALFAACRSQLRRDRTRLEAVTARLRDPRETLRAQRLRIDELSERARRAIEASLRLSREKLRGEGERLNALSPLRVLERGYSITRRLEDGHVVRAASEVSLDEQVHITLRAGSVRARVESRCE